MSFSRNKLATTKDVIAAEAEFEGDLKHTGVRAGFFGKAPVTRPEVGGVVALESDQVDPAFGDDAGAAVTTAYNDLQADVAALAAVVEGLVATLEDLGLVTVAVEEEE
jgi:hypothetical protein